jgi:hypothetical protein
LRIGFKVAGLVPELRLWVNSAGSGWVGPITVGRWVHF